jgi:hypothetical protein
MFHAMQATKTAPLRQLSRTTVLRRHFFRRFFDNDSLSWQGETETTVARALCACAAPGLMIAFWMLPHYPTRSTWGMAADRYVFVLLSYVIMGIVTTCEWEMLFPDRADFQILLPMPLRSYDLFVAKSSALLLFLGLFLFASNILGLVIFSMAKTGPRDYALHTAAVHAVATAMAGICGAASVLSVEGLIAALLPHSWKRRIVPLLQAVMIAFFLLMLALYPLIVSKLQPFLEGRTTLASYLPPLWFLGLYERLLLGGSAPAGAAELARQGLLYTLLAFGIAAACYPIAWKRQKQFAMEGAPLHSRPRIALARWLHRTLLKRPQERAVFHFLQQTLFRNERYRVYLALYAGVGFACALAVTLRLQLSADSRLTVTMASYGLRAAMPLLLFWMAVGLRMAFGSPVQMRARWVFTMHLLHNRQHLRATRMWALLSFAALTCGIAMILYLVGWRGWPLLQQFVWGCAISFLLADLFFYQRAVIPFTYPRLPGRVNLPVTLLLFTSGFPGFVMLAVYLETRSEADWTILLRACIVVALLHAVLSLVSRILPPDTPLGFLEEEPEDEFQRLGIYAQ